MYLMIKDFKLRCARKTYRGLGKRHCLLCDSTLLTIRTDHQWCLIGIWTGTRCNIWRTYGSNEIPLMSFSSITPPGVLADVVDDVRYWDMRSFSGYHQQEGWNEVPMTWSDQAINSSWLICLLLAASCGVIGARGIGSTYMIEHWGTSI